MPSERQWQCRVCFQLNSNNQRWLVDGGLVNPLPVTACRSLGADIVIGVNLNSDILSRQHDKTPGFFSTITNTINIFQNQITQSST